MHKIPGVQFARNIRVIFSSSNAGASLYGLFGYPAIGTFRHGKRRLEFIIALLALTPGSTSECEHEH
jgi:hypothetical protein